MAMVALSDPFVRLSSDVLYMLDNVPMAVARGTRKIAREKSYILRGRDEETLI